MIDLYCERVAPGPWGEPLNTLSNLAFFIAAWAIWRLMRRQQAMGPANASLLLLMLAIGTGSTLFHVFANRWSSWCDVLPIAMFQLGFMVCYLRRIVRLAWLPTLFVVVLFALASRLAEAFPQWLNGSLGYAPALIVLLSLGLWHARRVSIERRMLFAAGLLFAVSLGFRSIDNALCPVWPAGTHWLWHLCNGAVLYMSMRVLILNDTSSPRGFHG